MVDNSVDLFAPPEEQNRARQQPVRATPSIPPNQEGGATDTDLFAPPPVEGVTATRVGASESAQPADDLYAPPPSNLFDAPPTQDPYGKLRSEMDQGIVESVKHSPGMSSTPITDSDLQTIASRHGVSASELRDWMPYFLGTPGDENIRLSDVPKYLVGTAGTALGSIPQKIAKKTQTPEMERALDDLQELSNRRLSLLGAGATIAAPGVGVAGKAGTAAKLAAGAATGAGFGFGGSRQGTEAESTLIGAGVGLGLGGVGVGVSKLLQNRATRRVAERATTEAEQSVENVAAHGGADFSEGVRQVVEERAPADELIRQHIFGNVDDSVHLSPEQARTIARAYAPQTVADLTDAGTEAGADFIRKHSGLDPIVLIQAAEQEVATTTLRNATDQMARDVFKRSIGQADDPRAMLRSWAGMAEKSGQGVEYADKRLQDLLNARTAEQYVRSKGIAQGEAPSFMQKSADWLSDAQYVLRGMDEKWKGLGAEAAHKEINYGVNRMSFPREDMRQTISGIFRANRRAGVDAEAQNAGDLIRRVEAGEQLTAPEERAFAPFREFFAEGIAKVNKLAEEEGIPPLAIKERPNYIPAQLMDSSSLRQTVSTRIQALVNDAERISGQRYTDVAQIPMDVFNRVVNESPEHSSTLKFLHTLSGETGNSPADISLMWKNTFLNPEGRNKLETVARAALEREDLIPAWAREHNLYKLADKWTTNTLRHLYLRKGIDKLRNVSHMLRNLGAESSADYTEKLLADLMGTRKGTAAEYFSKSQDAFHSALDRRIRTAGSDYEKAALQTVKMVPTMLQDMAKQVYPNLLGALNPRTLITNLTQTFTKTLPEFGGPYGSLLFLRGAARVGGIRNLPKYMRRMEAMGLAPRRYVGGSLDYLDEGLMRSGIAQNLKRGTRAVAEIGMKPYEWAETVNRGIAFGSSEMLANDLIKGSKLAESALMRMPSSVRSAVERARVEGDVGEMVRQIATHVINSTQYQYNRASMSEYGRTMGPLFSTFSKWPTATLGQVVEGYRTKGAAAGTARLAEQLVAPWALLEGADYLMGQYSDEGLTDRQKKLFSAQGLSQAAPIGTLKGIATGDFFTPPAIDTALKLFVQPGHAKDSEEAIDGMRKAAENGIYMFAPGGMGGWIRFITDDLTTLATGERPEGSTFMERTAEGLHKLGVK